MKSQLNLIAMVLVVLAIVSPAAWAGETTPASLDQTFEAISKDFAEISKSATDLLQYKESEFWAALEKTSADLNMKIDGLEEKMTQMSDSSGEMLENYAALLKEKNKEWTEKSKAGLARAKEEFQKQLDGTLANMEGDIAALKETAVTMSDENREQLKKRLEEMRVTNKAVVEKMKALKKTGVASWAEIKKIVFENWEELRDTYRGMLQR